jgi:two-component system invasion response regulator UvrY
MPRVLIADDHVLIREGLRKVLAREADMQVVAEACNFSELMAAVESTAVDVVLMDINMPGAGAFESLRRIRARRAGPPVIVLSMMPEGQVALDLLIAGAAGYISKEAAATELVAAIRKVVSGYRYMSPSLASRFAQPKTPSSRALLSPRELEVLCFIAGGLSVKEIAAQLGLSISTVHTHRASLLGKLQLRSDVELSLYAIRHRLVDLK